MLESQRNHLCAMEVGIKNNINAFITVFSFSSVKDQVLPLQFIINLQLITIFRLCSDNTSILRTLRVEEVLNYHILYVN